MAELLIKAVDATHSDPAKDARGCYKRGDVVVAFEDGHQWGRLESLPPEKGGKFVIVKIPGVTLSELHEQTSKAGAKLVDPAIEKSAEVTARRAIKIDLDAMLPAQKDSAERVGELILSKANVAELAKRKASDVKSESTPKLENLL